MRNNSSLKNDLRSVIPLLGSCLGKSLLNYQVLRVARDANQSFILVRRSYRSTFLAHAVQSCESGAISRKQF